MGPLFLLLGRHDERILLALIGRRRVAVDHLMRFVTHLGDAWLTLSIALLALLKVTPELAPLGGPMAFALVVSHLGVQLLKRSISRPRPRLPVGTASMIEAPDRFSFPSGHAAASMSLALPIAGALPPVLGAAVAVLAALVGLSRCYLGVHYPGDVLVGWLLAGGAFWIWPRVVMGFLA